MLRANFPQRVTCFLVGFFAAIVGTPALAHSVGESYVWLNVEEDRFSGRVEINLDDIREKLGIDVPRTAKGGADDRKSVLDANRETILNYVEEHFQITSEGERVPVEYAETRIRDLTAEEGNYVRYDYVTPQGVVPDSITIRNSLFCEGDPLHRSLVCIEKNEKSGQEFEGEFVAMVFGSHNPEQELDLTNIESLLRPRDFVWQGVLHIWIGTDHILFIIALLLPAVLVRSEGEWKPVSNFKQAFFSILKIVTIFTVAHSITLSLAALGLIDLQSRLVESVIALSIILVAVNTIRPKFNDKTWLIIFGFGLFHGMGFASVMSDLPFRMIHLVKVLIGFNVGVELGQLAIVAVVFPIIFLLRKSEWYQSVVLTGGSTVIGVIASIWFVERAFDVEIFGAVGHLHSVDVCLMHEDRSALLLSHSDVALTIQRVGPDVFMRELIDAMERELIEFHMGRYDIPVRTGFHYQRPVVGLVEWMPLHCKHETIFLKSVGYHPTNPQSHRLPTVVGTFHRFDPSSGRMTALIDGALLTAMRTGAASRDRNAPSCYGARDHVGIGRLRSPGGHTIPRDLAHSRHRARFGFRRRPRERRDVWQPYPFTWPWR